MRRLVAQIQRVRAPAGDGESDPAGGVLAAAPSLGLAGREAVATLAERRGVNVSGLLSAAGHSST